MLVIPRHVQEELFKIHVEDIREESTLGWRLRCRCRSWSRSTKNYGSWCGLGEGIVSITSLFQYFQKVWILGFNVKFRRIFRGEGRIIRKYGGYHLVEIILFQVGDKVMIALYGIHKSVVGFDGRDIEDETRLDGTCCCGNCQAMVQA